jgi:hypothetical protein
VEPRLLRFYVPKDAVAELAYGSSAASAPVYDITAALQQGRPSRFNRAALGPVVDQGKSDQAVAGVARGGAIERASWKIERPIVLPSRGPIAYLDVEGANESLRDLRIVDAASRQVPYIVEAEPRHRRLPLAFRSEHKGGDTVLYLDGMDDVKTIASIELEASSPDYFAREVKVIEQVVDDRGRTEPRSIGAARWVRAAGQPAVPLRVAVGGFAGRDVSVHISDGDNAPLAVSSIAADVTRRRVNFVFAANDELRLWSGNDRATAPAYDLALIAERVLSSPAEPASLGPAHAIAAAPKITPRWFWVFVFAAAIVLLIAFARTLKPAG